MPVVAAVLTCWALPGIGVAAPAPPAGTYPLPCPSSASPSAVACNPAAVPSTPPTAHATVVQLQQLIGEIPTLDTDRVAFHALDDHGQQLGALDPIADPAGGYLGVYHSPRWAPWGPTFRISVGHSQNLLHWKRIRVLDPAGGSMPTLRAIPGTGGYLLAYEKVVDGRNLIRIRYYQSEADLLAGRVAAQRNLPRRFSPNANGTPTIRWISWNGSPAQSTIALGFHYQSRVRRRPGPDREALGVLLGFRRWQTSKAVGIDRALTARGFQGNHGDWRQFSFNGFRWRLYEGQTQFDDFGTWHVVLNDPSSHAAYPLSLRVGSSHISSVGNPIVSQEPAPGGSGQVLVVTAFVFGASARKLKGELVYYQPI